MNYSIIHNIISGLGVDWDSALANYVNPEIKGAPLKKKART